MSRTNAYLFYLIQLTGVCFLYWSVQVLMPVVIETLLQGMIFWNTASVLYCWLFQMIVLSVSFSLLISCWKMQRVG